MKQLIRFATAMALAALCFTTAATAQDVTAISKQDVTAIIEEFRSGTLPITYDATPLLLPFATEWAALAATDDEAEQRAISDWYQVLAIPDERRLEASVEALVNSNEAVKFFTDERTVEAFNLYYHQAVNSGLSIGRIPRSKVMLYSILSHALAAGPDALVGDMTWCAPPFKNVCATVQE